MSKGDNKQVDAITSKALDDLFEDKPKVKPKQRQSTSSYWGAGGAKPSSYWNDYGNRDMFGRTSTFDSDFNNDPYKWDDDYTHTPVSRTSSGSILERTIRDDIEDNSLSGRLEIDEDLLDDMVQYAWETLDSKFQLFDIWLSGEKHEAKLREYLQGALSNGDLEKTGGRSLSIVFTHKKESK